MDGASKEETLLMNSIQEGSIIDTSDVQEMHNNANKEEEEVMLFDTSTHLRPISSTEVLASTVQVDSFIASSNNATSTTSATTEVPKTTTTNSSPMTTEAYYETPEVTPSKATVLEITTTTPTTTNSSHMTIETSGSPATDVVTTSDNESYCGPRGAQGWARAVTTCSRSTMCGAGGSCPNDMICYGGIICNIVIKEDQSDESDTSSSSAATLVSSPTSASTNAATTTSTTTTTSTATTFTSADSEPASTVSILNNRYYCGPDPFHDHNAWATALESCSSETACANDRPCPSGQICFGGIDCLFVTVAAKETTTTTPSIQAGTPASENIKHPTPSSSTETSATSSAQEDTTSSTSTATTRSTATTTASASDLIIDLVSTPQQKDGQTPQPLTSTNTYCGPDPQNNSDAWMAALANCSSQTACGSGLTPCPVGQFCYGNIDCSLKEMFIPAGISHDGTDKNAANGAEERTTTSSTSSKNTEQFVGDQEADIEENGFFCGPVDEGGAYFHIVFICQQLSK